MQSSGHITAGTVLSLLLFNAPVAAQESGSMTVGNVTVSVGVGAQMLDLPDIQYLVATDVAVNTAFLGKNDDSADFFDEYGWNIDGSISVPVTDAMSQYQSISLKGFFAKIDDDDKASCTGTAGVNNCALFNIVDIPGTTTFATSGVGESFVSNTSREVDHWGLSLEFKQQIAGEEAYREPGTVSNMGYLALGADIRSIDQGLDMRVTHTSVPINFRYKEDLETRYYGVYAAWGGDYTLPLISQLVSGLGLQSSFMFRGGVYYADTDFSGTSSLPGGLGGAVLDGTLNLSNDDVAFIGGLMLETRKQINSRAAFSLKGGYEYYSYVPKMTYNTFDDADPLGITGTPAALGDDDASSLSASLHLTINLGPDSVFD